MWISGAYFVKKKTHLIWYELWDCFYELTTVAYFFKLTNSVNNSLNSTDNSTWST